MIFPVASLRSFRPRPYHAAAAVLFVIAGAVFYLPYLSDLPTGIHTWAQCDRLALALMYYDYGFHFLTPRTYALVSIGGITGVEFPLQAYLAALGGLLFGRGSIVTLFRLLDVAMTLIGFYYLFRLIFERTGHFVAGLVPGAFLLASPFFAFYAGNFLPDPFSLSLSFVGCYYWLRFFDDRRFGDLRMAVAVFTVAGLVKTTVALHFGAVVGITLLWAFLQPALLLPKERRQLLVLAGAGAGLIVFFFLHNLSLNETYQSWLFLAKPNPVQDAETWHDVLYYIRLNWLGEYATVTQYRTLAVCAGLFAVFLLPNLRRYLPLTLLLVASALIAYGMVLMMGAQLGVHDYYIVCIMGPPAMLLLVLALLNLGRYGGWARYVTSIGLATLLFFLVANGYKRLHRRMSDDYPPFSPYSHVWMRGGAAELAAAGVPSTSSILVFGEDAPNVALVYFDRRGINWRAENPALITPADFLDRMAADSLNYLVMPPAVYAQLAPRHAAMAVEFETVGQQPAMVFRRRKPAAAVVNTAPLAFPTAYCSASAMTRLIRKARLLALLSLGAATGCRPRDGRPTTQQRELMHTSFEELVGRAPQVLPTLTTAKAHTGKYAMRVDPEHPYSFTYRATLGSLCTHRPRRFTLSAWAWVSSFQDNAVVVAVLSNPSDPNHPLLTKYLYLSDNNSLGQWNHVRPRPRLTREHSCRHGARCLPLESKCQPARVRRRPPPDRALVATATTARLPDEFVSLFCLSTLFIL